jgi:predicted DNA binding CopG/RHH family protein
VVSEKQSDMKKLIEKMRTNTEQQNRKTDALPRRRARKKMQKGRTAEGSKKAK